VSAALLFSYKLKALIFQGVTLKYGGYSLSPKAYVALLEATFDFACCIALLANA